MSDATNTADLYTGATSGSFGNYREDQTRKQAKTKKQSDKAKLLPAYEVVKKLIDDELAQVKNIETFVLDVDHTEENVRNELDARFKYLAFLNGLNAKIHHTLKEQKK